MSQKRLAVTGIGLCTPLGPDPAAAIAQGKSAVFAREDMAGLPDDRTARMDRIELSPWLKRRKDRKLMARASELALAAAGRAIATWPGDRAALGLFLGVGREPGDEGESEAALLAAQHEGRVDLERVAGPCRDLYPPLLPLKTLPNMALAHISIHLGVCGENGAFTGAAGAGMAALRAGCWSVLEGRCPAALIGAADSLVSGGTIRDRYRVSGQSLPPPVGEAGVMLLVEPEAEARARSAPIYAFVSLPQFGTPGQAPGHHALAGDCGAADGVLAVALAILGRAALTVVAAADIGHPDVCVEISVDTDAACYTPAGQGEHA